MLFFKSVVFSVILAGAGSAMASSPSPALESVVSQKGQLIFLKAMNISAVLQDGTTSSPLRRAIYVNGQQTLDGQMGNLPDPENLSCDAEFTRQDDGPADLSLDASFSAGQKLSWEVNPPFVPVTYRHALNDNGFWNEDITLTFNDGKGLTSIHCSDASRDEDYRSTVADFEKVMGGRMTLSAQPGAAL